MRLIDADALMDEINWLIGQAARYNRVSYEDFAMRVKNAPAIEIVRCGECIWFDHREGCFFSTSEIDSEGFCSFGER